MWNFSNITGQTNINPISTFDKIIFRSFLYISITWFSVKWIHQFFTNQKLLLDDNLILPTLPILSPDELFKQNLLKRFLSIFGQNRNAYNSNIESVFYVKDDYILAIKEKDNALEKTWKSRILMVMVPSRGNIIMHFDAYKGGFAYYSDQSIPYPLLNAVAMKYVITYRCRDFFLDEQIIPENCASPLLSIFTEENKPTASSDNDELKNKKMDIKTGPFAKLKQYSVNPNSLPVASTNSSKNVQIDPKVLANITDEFKKSPTSMEPPKYVNKNKFIYLGKIRNFALLSKPSKPVKTLHTVKIADLPVTSKPIVKYSDFKFWRSPNVSNAKVPDNDFVHI